MAENDRALEPNPVGDEEEIDPLDAFMAAEIAPAVRQGMQTAQSVKLEDTHDAKPATQASLCCTPPSKETKFKCPISWVV